MIALTAAAWASDHIDGKAVTHRRAADLSDVYAWTPEAGHLAIGLMSRPFSGRRARFHPDLLLRVLVRRAEAELRIECAPVRGDRRREDALRCSLAGPLGSREVEVVVDAEGAQGDLRLFAGVRRDPFFINTGAVSRDQARDGDRQPPGGPDSLANVIVHSRVLALVVELEVAAFFGPEPGVLAVAGESDWRGERYDRVGRPELTGFVLASGWGEGIPGEDVRDTWNADSTFALSAGHRHFYEATMAAGLARLDALDRFADPGSRAGREEAAGPDWATPHPLAEVLLTDALLVDPAVACAVDAPTLFEIELAGLQAFEHVTCGGRTPNVDAVDAVLTLFTNGPERVPPGVPTYGTAGLLAPDRGDGWDRPKDPATDDFPYFQAP